MKFNEEIINLLLDKVKNHEVRLFNSTFRFKGTFSRMNGMYRLDIQTTPGGTYSTAYISPEDDIDILTSLYDVCDHVYPFTPQDIAEIKLRYQLDPKKGTDTPQQNIRCEHKEFIDVGFMQPKLVCKYCDIEKDKLNLDK